MDSLIVNNLTKISKMAFFFNFNSYLINFFCNFFDGMNASVYESKCFDLLFAERKKQWDPVRFSGTPLSQYI